MHPYTFDEFFASKQEESISPFLTRNSRSWGRYLSLKSALLAAFLLALSALFSSPLALSGVFFLVGTPALIGSLEDLKNLEINIDVLMTIAAFSALFIGSSLEGGLLLVLFELSGGLEALVASRARGALHNLNHLAPRFIPVLQSDGIAVDKAVSQIEVGEIILLKTGEISPLDGVIISGHSSVNLVHLTGESLPAPKAPGDPIAAGSRNLESLLTIRVDRIHSESTLSRIIRLIGEAQTSKPKLEQFLDRFGKPYATSIILLTFAFVFFLPYPFETSVYRALAFLVAASPCALIIATPTAYLSALSATARKGILLKGGALLDSLAACTQIAFDKTGTLTTGELLLTSIDPPSSAALRAAAALEQHVVHPIALSILKACPNPNLALTSFQSIPGKGLSALHEGLPLAIGLPSFVAPFLPPEQATSLLSRAAASSELHTALAFQDRGYLLRFSDEIRPSAFSLSKLSLTTLMLTGDHPRSAEKVARELGLTQIYASLSPEDKLKKVAELSATFNLAMVGDGINDAPALARATVGIAMGRIGSFAAVDAADVVLLSDDLSLLPWLFKKAGAARRVVRQNLSLALLVIGCASLPALLGVIPLWGAVLLHEGGTLLVGLNSLRLLRE
jgi:heavy metal translocating P-type ATPase